MKRKREKRCKTEEKKRSDSEVKEKIYERLKRREANEGKHDTCKSGTVVIFCVDLIFRTHKICKNCSVIFLKNYKTCSVH